MNTMLVSLGLAAGAFLITHVGLSSTALRGRLVGRLGEKRYLIVYSTIALLTLGGMIVAYTYSPHHAFLWLPGPGLRHLPILIMPLAFILLVAGLVAKNPTAVGMETAIGREDSVRGILRITRHPVQWALLLWSFTHILANGDAASVLFFGSFFVLSAIGPVLIDRKLAAEFGDGWERFRAASSNIPFAAILNGRQSLNLSEVGWRVPVIGLILYGLVLVLHPYVFGVSPY